MKLSVRRLNYLLTAVMALAFAVPSFAAVDINKADALTIAKELKGVGPAKAKAIVDYRAKNGAFTSIDELRKVSGIGDKLLEQNRTNIIVGSGGEPAKKGG